MKRGGGARAATHSSKKCYTAATAPVVAWANTRSSSKTAARGIESEREGSAAFHEHAHVAGSAAHGCGWINSRLRFSERAGPTRSPTVATAGCEPLAVGANASRRHRPVALKFGLSLPVEASNNLTFQ